MTPKGPAPYPRHLVREAKSLPIGYLRKANVPARTPPQESSTLALHAVLIIILLPEPQR